MRRMGTFMWIIRVEGDGIMTIDGNATIHGNCTGGPGTIYTDEDYRKPNYKNDDPNSYYYDLDASSSSIHFVEPTRISLGIDSNNGGRGTFAIIDKDGKININATKNIWSKRITKETN